MSSSAEWLKAKWCGWTHGGGVITRDPLDRINWQCVKCGRWSDPISHEEEKAIVDLQIKAKELNRNG